MKETGLTGKRRSTTIAATPDDGNSQRKRRRGSMTVRNTNMVTMSSFAVMVHSIFTKNYRKKTGTR